MNKRPMEKIGRYIKLLRKYNTLVIEHEVLKTDVKEDAFNKLLDKLGEPLEIKRLKTENRRLRIKVKELKQELLVNVSKERKSTKK